MSNLSVADVLDRAADLIEPEGAWTQGSYAQDASANNLMVGSAKGAVCWCALGSIDKIVGTEGREHPKPEWLSAARTLASILEAKCGVNDTITSFNDAEGRTQAEVVAKLRQAASLAREQGK